MKSLKVILMFVVISMILSTVVTPDRGQAAPPLPTIFRLDKNAAGYLEKVNNINNLGVVVKDDNVLKAEYKAGFIQGHLQRNQLAATRDNLWDAAFLVDSSPKKKIPPTEEQLLTSQDVLAKNYAYTLSYINRQSDAKLKEQLQRLVFRLLGIYHGATLSAPKTLTFDGKWMPGLDTFSKKELALSYQSSNVSFMDVYFMNAYNDLFYVVDDLEMAKCSAFVKRTADDIYITHNSWMSFLDQSMAASYYINGDFITFNAAYPGLIASTTDFGYNNKGILFNETTHRYTVDVPKTEALWILWRAAAAETYAASLDEYFKFISLENSGTYMNGYMIVDAKTREIGLIEMGYKDFIFFKSDDKGGYKITTSPPGLTTEYDKELIQPDIILGINYAASKLVRDELKGNDNRPLRRKQFLAQIGGVKDIESAKALITYVAPNEPLSIYGRWDLGYGTTDYPKTVPDGAVDAKAISASMIGYTKNLQGLLDITKPNNTFWMKFGTAAINGKPFIWSESKWKGQKLRLVPDKLDGAWTLLNLYIH